MNREGAETFLRLLAEAELRGQLAPASPPWAGGPGAGPGQGDGGGTGPDRRRSARHRHRGGHPGRFRPGRERAATPRQGQPGTSRNRASSGTGPAGAQSRSRRCRPRRRPAWPPQLQFGRPGRRPGGQAGARLPAGRGTGPPGPADPAPPDHDPDQGAADRFVPVGLTVPFHDEGISGDLYLMSFAHTGSGARFIAVWGSHSSLQLQMGLRHPDLIPFGLFTVTDDRGPGTSWTSRPAAAPNGPARSACVPPRRPTSAGSTSPRRSARRSAST